MGCARGHRVVASYNWDFFRKTSYYPSFCLLAITFIHWAIIFINPSFSLSLRTTRCRPLEKVLVACIVRIKNQCNLYHQNRRSFRALPYDWTCQQRRWSPNGGQYFGHRNFPCCQYWTCMAGDSLLETINLYSRYLVREFEMTFIHPAAM